jgi:hypothetical protein
MLKRFLFIFLFLISLIIVSPVAAQEQKQVTIINPIRGDDFWSYPYSVLTTPKKQYELISSKNIEATWMARFDALINPEIQAFLKELNPKQEVVRWLHITR